MKNFISIIIYILIGFIQPYSFAQISIGTPTPHENADIHLARKNRTLILNHVDDKTAISNPYDGMIFYDSSEKCFRGYANGEFTDCFGAKTTDPVVRVDGPGFKGEFVREIALSNVTFEILVSNNTFREVTLGFHKDDLQIIADGINVASVKTEGVNASQSFNLNFPAGASKTIVYNLEGTPVAPYTEILGVWNKIVLSYESKAFVTYDLNCSNGSWIEPISPNFISGFRTNQSYSGKYQISYSADLTGFILPSLSQTISGVTLSSPGGIGQNTGVIEFDLQGTYTGEDFGNILYDLYGSCEIELKLFKSCKDILSSYSDASSGIYKIDVDGSGPLEPMNCYCDMDTDGGGWTLVLNYNHKGGTNPELLVRTNDLPLLSSASLGVDESEIENSKYWGHFSNSLASKFDFNEVRFYGISNSMTSEIIKPAKTALGNDGRVMNFVTNHPNVINYIKTGSGSMSGIQKLITPTNIYGYRMLVGHTTHLPYVADSFMKNYGDLCLAFFPFYKESTITWGIRPYFNGYYRWEVDEWANSYMYNTHHQVWVR